MLRTVKFALIMARRSIGRRKFRSALTILGVIIGISTMVSLMTIGYGMRQQVETTLNEMLGAGIVISSPGGGVDIPEHVQYWVLQVPGVNDSVPVITTMMNIGDRPIAVVGIDPTQATKLYHITFEAGGIPTDGEKNAAILGGATAAELGVHVNDRITLSTQLGGVGETFEVTGILRSIGGGQLNIGCFITLRAAQRLLGKDGYVSTIMVRLDNPIQGEQVEAILKNMFPNARIVRQEEIMGNIDRIMNIINGVLLALASISLGVGALGIMNTIMMSVHERRREIGMLKAVGAERRHILLIFLSEALLISLTGGTFGCILGLFGVYLIQWFVTTLGWGFTIPLLISPYILGTALLAAMAIGTIAGFYPSWTAANVRPVEALRYE